MERLIIEVDSAGNAQLLADLMESLGFVGSVIHETYSTVNASLTDADWARSGRAATDAEHENMVVEAKGEYRSGNASAVELVQERTRTKFMDWKKANQL